jgi:hypothetical protein
MAEQGLEAAQHRAGEQPRRNFARGAGDEGSSADVWLDGEADASDDVAEMAPAEPGPDEKAGRDLARRRGHQWHGADARAGVDADQELAVVGDFVAELEST